MTEVQEHYYATQTTDCHKFSSAGHPLKLACFEKVRALAAGEPTVTGHPEDLHFLTIELAWPFMTRMHGTVISTRTISRKGVAVHLGHDKTPMLLCTSDELGTTIAFRICSLVI